jgi:hypothetical protein
MFIRGCHYKKSATNLYFSTDGTVGYLVVTFHGTVPVYIGTGTVRRYRTLLSVLWILIRIRMFLGLPDLDCRHLYGSGSFHQQAKRVRKTLIFSINLYLSTDGIGMLDTGTVR